MILRKGRQGLIAKAIQPPKQERATAKSCFPIRMLGSVPSHQTAHSQPPAGPLHPVPPLQYEEGKVYIAKEERLTRTGGH